MRLITAHKILIAAALVLSLLLTARGIWMYGRTHQRTEASFAATGVLLAVPLGLYLRALRRRRF
jgi:hypothetical protein